MHPGKAVNYLTLIRTSKLLYLAQFLKFLIEYHDFGMTFY